MLKSVTGTQAVREIDLKCGTGYIQVQRAGRFSES